MSASDDPKSARPEWLRIADGLSGAEREALAVQRLAALSPGYRAAILAGIRPGAQAELAERWSAWAHAGQLAPPGDWTVWLIRAGRGFGKTRAGAEWVSAMARTGEDVRIALVGATAEEVRRVMIDGESGLRAVARPDETVVWRASAGEVHFPSGAIATVYSAHSAEGLRGPQHHFAWCDELAKWRNGDAAWDNLMMGVRLGERPRVLVTTTPRANALMKRVMALPGLVETCGRTRDNPHLPASWLDAMDAMYADKALGRQELDGELIDDAEGALWTRAMLERCRVAAVGLDAAWERVVVGVDPPAGTEGDACGIVAVALLGGVATVLEDASVARRSPEGWARAVADCAARWSADRVVAEVNQGGDMVLSTLRAADAGLAVSKVHATRGKTVRADPVAALYERGKVRHAGGFAQLEDELCGMLAGGAYVGPGRSPDRADALVWALTELMLGKRGKVGVRGL